MKLENGISIEQVSSATQQLAKKIVLDGLKERFVYFDENFNTDLNDILKNYIDQGNEFYIGINQRDQVVCTGALVAETIGVGSVVRMSVEKEKGIVSYY